MPNLSFAPSGKGEPLESEDRAWVEMEIFWLLGISSMDPTVASITPLSLHPTAFPAFPSPASTKG